MSVASCTAVSCWCLPCALVSIAIVCTSQNDAGTKWTREYLQEQFGDSKNEADLSNWDNHFMFYRGGVRCWGVDAAVPSRYRGAPPLACLIAGG